MASGSDLGANMGPCWGSTWAHVGSKKPSWRVLGGFGGLLGRLGSVLTRLEKSMQKKTVKYAILWGPTTRGARCGADPGTP